MITARSRGKCFSSPARIACTTVPRVFALLNVGKPTRRSTSPTLMSWRRKSSLRTLLSARRTSTDSSNLPQTEPKELIGPQGQQIWQLAHAGKNIFAEHLDQDIAFIALQIQCHSLCGTGEVVHNQHSFAF